MNEQNAAILRKAGVRAVSVQPGYTERFAPFTDAEPQAASPVLASLPAAARIRSARRSASPTARSTSLFMGPASPRREKLLATYADNSPSSNTFIYCTRIAAPADARRTIRWRRPTSPPPSSAARKMLINLHRDEYTYFEWWRLMQAFWHEDGRRHRAVLPASALQARHPLSSKKRRATSTTSSTGW